VDIMVSDTVPERLGELSLEQTVPRRLVHRSAVAEVFITDSRQTGADRYAAAAQLPPLHGHFGDSVRVPAAFDALLLLECCRQAGIYGAYRHLGLPGDTTFLVNEAAVSVTDPDRLVLGHTPGSLYLLTAVERQHDRAGTTRALRFTTGMRLESHPVGTATIGVTCLDPPSYRALRRFQRADEPPGTDAMADRRWPDPVPPRQVGRYNPVNVLLAGALRTPQGAYAELAPRFDNRSLFDHSYDHYPAMVVLEAARQLALLAVHARARLDRVAGRFLRVAELDRPVHATARTAAGRSTVDVSFTQSEQVAAQVTVGLAAVGASR
jgi:hypothetical protein